MHALPAVGLPPGRFSGHHAIVIGGSIAGLVAARVLSAHFDRVTVFDRDELPADFEQRRGVPQGRHGHGVLASGLRGLSTLFPGFDRELLAAGAVHGDVIGSVRWFQHGRYKAKFTSGLDGILLSRPMLEVMVRRRVEQLPNVRIAPGSRVMGVLPDRGAVHGVRVRRADGEVAVVGDLVVDASGRTSRSMEWLHELGYPVPAVEEVSVGLGYTTRIFRRLPSHLDGDRGVIISPTPPREKRVGFMLAMEGDRWIVSLGGWLGNHAPVDLPGFLAFARSLGCPDIADVIEHAEPIGDAATFGFPCNVRRRYDRLTQFPSNYLVMGDALCTFNPIYGQGMSVATLEALALRDCLERAASSPELWKAFFAASATIIEGPWTIACGGDFAYEGVTGAKPAGVDVINRYIAWVHRAAATDRTVCRAFFDVANLLAPASSLFRPSLVARVVRECVWPHRAAPASRDRKGHRMVKPA